MYAIDINGEIKTQLPKSWGNITQDLIIFQMKRHNLMGFIML